jgi:hypothetical protein
MPSISVSYQTMLPTGQYGSVKGTQVSANNARDARQKVMAANEHTRVRVIAVDKH